MGESLGKYWGNLRVAGGKAPGPTLTLLVLWAIFPTAVQTVFHPWQAIGFQFWLQKLPVPRLYTPHQVSVGEMEALAAMVVLGLMTFFTTVAFYRSATFSVKLWPVPGIFVGCVGGIAWWYYTGFFDTFGALALMTSLALMVLCEALCEHLGQDFVFGKGVRPQPG
jgi:hypothetical protein